MKGFVSDVYSQNDLRILTPDDGGNYFFGYYDMPATDSKGRHLAHRTAFADRLPDISDIAEIGYLEDGRFYKIAETSAWNFQQGAMLRYHPTAADTVCYNAVKDGNYVTVTNNYVTGEKRFTDRAVASVSPDGAKGLAVNFGRIFAFRPGYGYAGCADRYAEEAAPRRDGVFLTDMKSGSSELLLSYADMLEESGFGAGDKILVNHITFAPDSFKYVMPVRQFPKPGESDWRTSMMIGDVNGNCKTLIRRGFCSHYQWVDENAVMAYCSPDGEKADLYRIDTDGNSRMFDMAYFSGEGNRDIHCSLSPDGSCIIGDGYPLDGGKYRYLMFRSVDGSKEQCLFKVLTDSDCPWDARCDLHARFAFGGRYISFDTTHNGMRQIAAVPAPQL